MMFFLFVAFFACRPPIEIDATWSVTVTGTETSCVQDTTGFIESYDYGVIYDGTKAKIYIEESMYATGDHRGCSLQYKSAAYLEDSSDGRFTWDITGSADVQGAAGGCDLQEGLDWEGTETLTVLESENPNVEEGCTYNMSVEGAFLPN
jgi:hypothetical protein